VHPLDRKGGRQRGSALGGGRGEGVGDGCSGFKSNPAGVAGGDGGCGSSHAGYGGCRPQLSAVVGPRLLPKHRWVVSP
jgi:hypothetical protein